MLVIIDLFVTKDNIKNLEMLSPNMINYHRFDCTEEEDGCFTYYLMEIEGNDQVKNYIKNNKLSFVSSNSILREKKFVPENNRENIITYIEMYGKNGTWQGKPLASDLV